MAKVTRVDTKNSFVTVFKFEDGNSGSEFWVPIDKADAYETKIINASWATLNTLWLQDGETIIKQN